MNIKETKTMVNTILDLNESDDKFTYAPWVSIYQEGHIIVACSIQSKRTGEAKHVQDFNGDIFQRIDDARNDLITSEAKYIESKKIELEEELKKLNKLCGIPSRVQTDNIPKEV